VEVSASLSSGGGFAEEELAGLKDGGGCRMPENDRSRRLREGQALRKGWTELSDKAVCRNLTVWRLGKVKLLPEAVRRADKSLLKATSVCKVAKMRKNSAFKIAVKTDPVLNACGFEDL
jgi:hypothetical protein